MSTGAVVAKTRSPGGSVCPGPDATGPSRPSPRGRCASDRETTMVVLCVSVLVVHALDDNFVQPEPGTVAGDHLASGLIPVLLLAATAVALLRLRPGGRAVVAMTLGALGVVIGTPAGGVLRAPRGRVGDHYMGLLVLVAGAAPLLAGPVPPPPITKSIGGIGPRPVLLIYAEPGVGGESTRQREFFAAAGEPRVIWKVTGSSHTGGNESLPLEYERRVTAFFETALLGTNHPRERSRQ